MPIDVEQLPSPHSDKRARPSYEVRLDVTGTPGVPGDLDVAATVFLPQDIHDGLPLLVAFPGGGYSRRYYAIEKVPGYSQAAYHTSQGAVFVAIDHLGVGESSQPDPFSLSFENLAAANHLAVVHLRTGLQDGSLLHGLTFVPGAVIGIGQSMGACLLTVQQANHRTFDAVAFLGWSAIFTTFPSPEGGRLIFPNPKRGTDLRQFTGLADAPTPDEFRFGFHWPDEPPELIEADLRSMNAEDAQQMAGIGGPSSQGIRGDSDTPWASPTMPPVGICMATEGVVASEAAVIDVPVLIGAGERDFVEDPWSEPTGYRSSKDITLVVIPKMAHMHNFAPTRAEMWTQIGAFASRARARAEASNEETTVS
jgi:pimeloyl-ACP methyl ester carboxylesterase